MSESLREIIESGIPSGVRTEDRVHYNINCRGGKRRPLFFYNLHMTSEEYERRANTIIEEVNKKRSKNKTK